MFISGVERRMENKTKNQLEKRLFYYIIMTMLILLMVFSVLTNVDKIRDYLLDDSNDEIGRFIQAGVTVEQAWKNIDNTIVNTEDAETYGTVWYYDLCNDAGIYPLINPVTKLTMNFLDWLEYYVDKTLELDDDEYFGYAELAGVLE